MDLHGLVARVRVSDSTGAPRTADDQNHKTRTAENQNDKTLNADAADNTDNADCSVGNPVAPHNEPN